LKKEETWNFGIKRLNAKDAKKFVKNAKKLKNINNFLNRKLF